MKSVAVVIPALNEAEHIQSNLMVIGDAVRQVPAVRFTLVVVDDGSTDDTAAKVRAAREQAQDNVEIHLLSLNRHFGKEAAISAGLQACQHYDAVVVMEFDAVIPRIGASVTLYGCAVLRQFEVGGTYSVNESVAITRSRDKLRAHQLLARRGVGQPVTSYAHSADATEDLIQSVGGAPLLVKVLRSTQGNGVVLAETHKAAESLINAFRGLEADFLVQEFIKEASGTDIRCFVVGDKVVAAMQRQAMPGEFRSNLHRGGTAKVVKLRPDERKLATKAAQVMGLDVAGVDIIRSNHGPLVLEVNSSPGLEGIEKATGMDIAGAIIEYIEKDSQRGPNRMRGKG